MLLEAKLKEIDIRDFLNNAFLFFSGPVYIFQTDKEIFPR